MCSVSKHKGKGKSKGKFAPVLNETQCHVGIWEN